MQRTLGSSINFTKPLGQKFKLTLGLIGQNTTLSNGGDISTLLTSMENRAIVTGMANNLTDATNIANSNRALQLKGGTFATISPGFAYDTRDAAVDPTRGTYAKITGSPSLGLGNASMMKAGVSASKFIPLTRETTLALNAQGGTSLGGVPQFGMYNLGGFNGVRGYRQFSDLGTGTGMLMGTAELRRHLPILHSSDNKYLKKIDQHVKGAFFLDWGQVTGNGDTNSLLSRAGMGASVGFGLRLKLPMFGMVRVDYGFPLLNSVMGGYTPRFTFGFGERF
jgi:outer membrane protein assembly factor BamA